MADTLRLNIRQFAREFVAQHGRCDPEAVLDAIYERFGDDMRENWERETREFWRRDLKTEFARDDEDGEAVMQTALEGFTFPKVINVPREGGGITWVDGRSATREDVLGQRMLKNLNIISATRKRDLWDMKIDRLDVAWNVNAEWTVGECVEFLAGQTAASK